jgi:hypothetical protein
MPELAEEITGYVAGDDLTVTRTVTNLPEAMAKAWFTIKRYHTQSDDDAQIQKEITTDDEPNVGQITDAGGAGEDGALRFDFTAEDTEGLSDHKWTYDIQIKLSDGTVFTLEKGSITLTMDVTKTTT